MIAEVALTATSALVVLVVALGTYLKLHLGTMGVLECFALGFACTQCLPYVLYQWGVIRPPLAVADAIPEWSMLLDIVVVALDVMFYMIIRRLAKKIVGTCMPRLGPTLRQCVWLACAAYGIVVSVLIAQVLASPGLTNMSFRLQSSRVGPLVVVGSIQMGLLAAVHFDWMQKKHSTYSLILASIMAVPGWLIVGERSALVVPMIVLGLNTYALRGFQRARPMLVLSSLAASTAILVYTRLLKVGTWSRSPLGLLCDILARDFDTTWTLWYSLDAWARHVRIVPYPGAGYVNTLLAFLPRSLAPFKGIRAAVWLTASISDALGIPLGAAALDKVSWSYKLSFVTEAVVNGGPFLALALTPFFGLVLYLLEAGARRSPACFGPACLVAFSLWWSDSFALVTGLCVATVFAAVLSKSHPVQPSYTSGPFRQDAADQPLRHLILAVCKREPVQRESV